MNKKLNDRIRKELFDMQDEKYKKFHSGLCPNNDNIIGVRIPNLRKLARKIAKQENVEEYIKNAYNKYYEEVMLQGLVIGYAKIDIKQIIKLLDIFVPKIDNWAVSDSSISGFKFTKKNIEIMWEYINKYINSDKEFEARFSIIMMLDYYLNDAYIDKVIDKINSIQNIVNKMYYEKMAIAWLISVMYVKYKDKTKEFLKNNNLDDFTYNKALQKIIESNRVSKEEKEQIKKLKR